LYINLTIAQGNVELRRIGGIIAFYQTIQLALNNAQIYTQAKKAFRNHPKSLYLFSGAYWINFFQSLIQKGGRFKAKPLRFAQIFLLIKMSKNKFYSFLTIKKPSR
jgi:hypothetical protein